ncbi:hypothetical protein GPB2148_1383 [marine gamma proteobacterium HTCC2148]|nr:hypothetical protein GPB2148_1383 [marine gamma proteobacterium HTCC2148]
MILWVSPELFVDMTIKINILDLHLVETEDTGGEGHGIVAVGNFQPLGGC